MRLLLASLTALALCACTGSDTQETQLPTETVTAEAENLGPHQWLEDVEGEEALAWVVAQNTRSLDELRADPHFRRNLSAAQNIHNSDERIPYGSIRGNQVYNFWQDSTHPRGLWRRTSLESYATDIPEWETVLDFDALASAEDKNWVFKGSNCYAAPENPRTICMVSLSDGGKDAVIQREFDLETLEFVEGGFVTTEAKQGTSWIDYDTLLIGSDWGNDGSTLTESGYPTTVKRWTRGTELEAAETLFTGDKTDVGTWPFVLELEDDTRLMGVVQSDTFFTSKYFWIKEDGTQVQLPIPVKATPQGIFEGQFLFTLEQDWILDAQNLGLKAGDLAAFDFAAFMETRELPPVTIIFRPNAQQAVTGVSIAKDTALLSINDNVTGRILRLQPSQTGWSALPIPLPGSGQAGVQFADKDSSTVFLNYEGFLTPDSLLQYDTESGTVSPLKSLPEQFDAGNMTVTQKFATSTDGTQIPYFLIHKSDIVLNGETPTVLYGYGGFQISITPSYSGIRGALWLEQGGAYAIANIRGGGEFGPDWHQAGLKTNRQIIYDDFIAVAEDLIATRVTSPSKLGIMGRSNGGLLMGVMLTQRPDLWNAVDIGVPLLDMLRYHKLLAGASWVGEYGDPDIVEEAAFLETISPFHNFDPEADYPTPFFYTSTKDDRVHPGHARKMAALFEEANLPFFYYENIDGGHAGAANREELALRDALEYTYFANRLMSD